METPSAINIKGSKTCREPTLALVKTESRQSAIWSTLDFYGMLRKVMYVCSVTFQLLNKTNTLQQDAERKKTVNFPIIVMAPIHQ